MKINEIKIKDRIIYKNKPREVVCIDMVENLLGLKPLEYEPVDIIWARYENCTQEIQQMKGTLEALDNLSIIK